jgi:hypothetical protein
MNREIQTLKDLPLESLLSAPLNAAIAAQANAALSTVAFVEKVGFKSKDPRRSIFDRQRNEDESEVRIATLKVKSKRRNEAGELVDDDVEISLPYITLFNIPTLEIGSLDWSFNVKLNRVEELAVDFTKSIESTATGSVAAGGDLTSIGIPISIGGKMSVAVTEKTEFALRYGVGREQEYNLAITVRANQAPQPRGIQRLFDIAERVAADIAEARRPQNQPLPAPSPGS